MSVDYTFVEYLIEHAPSVREFSSKIYVRYPTGKLTLSTAKTFKDPWKRLKNLKKREILDYYFVNRKRDVAIVIDKTKIENFKNFTSVENANP